MKKLSKALCMIIAIALIVTCFVACGGDKTTQHSVTFNYNYEGAPASSAQKVDSGTHIDEPEDPTRTNWKFMGWYTDSACTKEADFGRVITSDTTFYARWELSNVVVTFSLNYDNAGNYDTQTIAVGGVPTRPTPNPSRSGYLFRNWYTVSDAAGQTTDKQFNFADTDTMSADMTLYAGWELPAQLVTVSFRYNYEGSLDLFDSKTITSGAIVSRPENIPERKDYIFRDWYTVSEHEDQTPENLFDFTSPITAATDVYAGWDEVQKVNVIFHFNYPDAPNNGVYEIQTLTVEDGEPTNATRPSATPERAGYIFTDWYTAPGSENQTEATLFDFTSDLTVNKDIYAGWERQVGDITVSFMYNYDGAPTNGIFATRQVTEGEAVSSPSGVPARAGYRFRAWYTVSTGQTDSTKVDFSAKLSEDTTYYAGWDEEKTIIISFMFNYTNAPNNGVYNTQSKTFIVGESAAATRPSGTPSREGHTFRNWYTVSETANQTDATLFDFSTNLNESIFIYAGWTEIKNTATVSYMYNYSGAPNGGIYLESEINFGSKASNLTPPNRTKNIYTALKLENWYTSASQQNETTRFDFDTAITSDISLYAKWTEVGTYEAELTDLTYFYGTGWSWSPTGTQGIDFDQYDSKAGYNAYMGNMYGKNTFIFFEIVSDRDVTGLTLKLRLSMEIFDHPLELWPEIYEVSTSTSFDGELTPINYDKITIENKKGYGVEQFENYLITSDLSLKQGSNFIYLITKNTFREVDPDHPGGLGSMQSFAPLVDSLIIEYAENEADLSYTPVFCNLWNYGYAPAEYPCTCDKHK